MTVYPVKHLSACRKFELPANTKVFNKNSVPYYMIIEVPYFVEHDLRFVGVYEDKSTGLEEVPLACIQRSTCHPYLDIMCDVLNMNVGQHEYQIHYIDPFTKNVIVLYFAYIIQDDNPDTPYVYMNR